jgi:hypothetical protein
MNAPSDPPRPGLLERLGQGPVLCAEGYVFELERRGYVQAGPYVPGVVLEHPEAVEQLHREFVRAGSDVVEGTDAALRAGFPHQRHHRAGPGRRRRGLAPD